MISELILKIKRTKDKIILTQLVSELLNELESLNFPNEDIKLKMLKDANRIIKGYLDENDHSYDSKDLDGLMMMSKL